MFTLSQVLSAQLQKDQLVELYDIEHSGDGGAVGSTCNSAELVRSVRNDVGKGAKEV